MIRVRVKICGVMTSEIAAVAAEAGADAIGLVFAPSRRRVTIEQASAIVAELPPFVAAVGVFVDMPADEVETTARGLPLDAVQLHGDEPPEMCSLLRRQGIRVIKAVRVADRVDVDLLDRYRSAAALMLDTHVDGLAGGSGRAFDLEAARGLSDRFPLILSGGLTPDNVGRALDIVRPYGVDVSSGVETDGRKSPEKIRQFIERVRQWEWGQ
jgi:phosphoribosylanthranilate isomerase